VATVMISEQALPDGGSYSTIFRVGAGLLAIGAFLTLFFSNTKTIPEE
jgi:hypothetical protein